MTYILLGLFACQEKVNSKLVEEVNKEFEVEKMVDKNNRLTSQFISLKMEEIRRNNENSGNFKDLDDIDDDKEKSKEAKKQREVLKEGLDPLLKQINAQINIELTKEAEEFVSTSEKIAKNCEIGFGFGWHIYCKFNAKLKSKLGYTHSLKASCLKGDTVVHATPSATIPYKAKKGKDFEMSVSVGECWNRNADKVLLNVVKQ
jgi:hypothetical protein